MDKWENHADSDIPSSFMITARRFAMFLDEFMQPLTLKITNVAGKSDSFVLWDREGDK